VSERFTIFAQLSTDSPEHFSPRRSPELPPPACALRPPHSARMLRQNGARGFSGPRMNIFQLE
ncbi:hypothetical protein LER59_30405, partial [Pseudomonas aeruginosa]